MRIRYFGLAIAAITMLVPLQAWGGDREIAEQIMARLKSNRDSGALKDFTLDMKVDQGVVLFRGSVSQSAQKDLVLKSADGVNGVAHVVDEVDVTAATPQAALPEAVAQSDFSLREALAAEAEQIMSENKQPVVPGEVRPTAGVALAAPVASQDQKAVAGVVSALGKAQKTGHLKGFGVDVKATNGVVSLKGRAASAAQRDRILRIAENVPGVQRVRNAIAVPAQTPAATLPEPPALRDVATTAQPASQLAPVAVDPVPGRTTTNVPVATAAAPVGVRAMATPYRNQAAHTPAAMAAMQVGGAPVLGQPVAMGGYAGAAGPRYDAPNLPNYAWPGYAAYPNYAAVTYPQQYSPSAFPYIGPFYPYPQVPMGWRRVSLEWKDGWWFLDFTDK